MKIKVIRERRGPEGISGHLQMPGFSCLTLEPTALAIPAGSYRVQLTVSERVAKGTLWSPLADKKLPLLVDVPERTGIRIHSGNKSTDSVGCILVGTGRSGTTITESRLALTSLCRLLVNEPDMLLEVEESYGV